MTPLIWAAKHGHLDVVKILLEAGANVDAKNKDGETALILAAGNTRQDLVVFELLRHGANVNELSNSNESALLMASEKRNEKVMRALLEKGADVTVKSKWGMTPLDFVKKDPDFVK